MISSCFCTFYKWRPTACVTLRLAFLTQHLWHAVLGCSFSWLNRIPLCEYTTICLSGPLLMGTELSPVWRCYKWCCCEQCIMYLLVNTCKHFCWKSPWEWHCWVVGCAYFHGLCFYIESSHPLCEEVVIIPFMHDNI